MMSRRTEISILVGLLVLLVALFYFNNRSQDPGIPGVLAADGKVQPLDVHEPQLRLDLLANLQKLAYSGSHRNIFVAAPPLPPHGPEQSVAVPDRAVGPVPPPSPPPLQVS